MWLLIVTTVLPRGSAGGAEIVSESVIEILRQTGKEVRVLGYQRPGNDSALRDGEICVGRRPVETSSAGARALKWLVSAITHGRPYSVTKYRSRAVIREVRRALEDQPAIVFVDHAQMHFVLNEPRRSGPPVVLIAHNAEGQNYARLSAASDSALWRWLHRREARLLGEIEAELARPTRQVWTLTEADAEVFRGLADDVDVRPLEVPAAILDPPSAQPTFDIGLIGSWTWRPNALGLEWFMDEVLPRLPDRLRIDVAGRGADWVRTRHPGVNLRGPVPDAARFLAEARVVAVPATTGGGVQVKTLDAIASGVSVVATPVAARGLGQLPRSVEVAAHPAEFAAALGRAVADAKRSRPDPEAISWSQARRQRFRAAVTSNCQELMDGHDDHLGTIPAGSAD